MSFPEFKMGIKRPESLDEQLAIQADVRAMRKAITFGQRDSPVIGRCLRIAEIEGLNSEETHVLIAYHALCQVQELWERQVQLSRLDIRNAFVPQSVHEAEKSR